MTLYPKLIMDALATVRYPGNGKNIVEAEMVADNLRIDGMKVSFSLIFEKPTDPFMKSVVKSAETAIHTYVSKEVEVTIATESKQAARPEPGKMLPQVKNVIAVSSGKGGFPTTSCQLFFLPSLVPEPPVLLPEWFLMRPALCPSHHKLRRKHSFIFSALVCTYRI